MKSRCIFHLRHSSILARNQNGNRFCYFRMTRTIFDMPKSHVNASIPSFYSVTDLYYYFYRVTRASTLSNILLLNHRINLVEFPILRGATILCLDFFPILYNVVHSKFPIDKNHYQNFKRQLKRHVFLDISLCVAVSFWTRLQIKTHLFLTSNRPKEDIFRF